MGAGPSRPRVFRRPPRHHPRPRARHADLPAPCALPWRAQPPRVRLREWARMAFFESHKPRVPSRRASRAARGMRVPSRPCTCAVGRASLPRALAARSVETLARSPLPAAREEHIFARARRALPVAFPAALFDNLQLYILVREPWVEMVSTTPSSAARAGARSSAEPAHRACSAACAAPRNSSQDARPCARAGHRGLRVRQRRCGAATDMGALVRPPAARTRIHRRAHPAGARP